MNSNIHGKGMCARSLHPDLIFHTLLASVQKWYPGQIELNQTVQLPKSLLRGNYELLLNLPDAYPSLKSRPEYSIRLANEGLWEEETGYNKLNHILHIN